ncbi:hypothetical protein ACCO45_006168 [Purpureocillium lilacinum]|uniref:Uncharacterized protein n=1 Tax=Purpureocillium lilacinum TaxID=33203 RepID=A0ACC4DXF3_PURLI
MASEQITLFDLRSKGPNHAWSLNPWKTRLLLNYKGLDYKTEWLNYPEIKPTLEAHVPPNAEGYPYSIPTVAFPDGTWIMESRAIATALVPAAMKALLPIFYANVPRRLLEPASLEYWYRVRGEKVGMPIDEFEAKHGGEAAYAAAEQPLRDVTAMYKENGGEGPFLQGAKVCYADFVWIAFLEFARRIGEDVYEGCCSGRGIARCMRS